MIHISQLFIYPVKSLGGIALQQAEVTSRGLEHDRRWMLVDGNNQFMSQRKFAQMALFKLEIHDEGIWVIHEPTHKTIIIPFFPQTTESVLVTIWDDVCAATVVNAELDEWFSNILRFKCRLVYMPDDSLRPVDPQYAGPEHITSFADAYPMLVISEESLHDLNSRLGQKVTMNRFRPNMVINGTSAYQEDYMLQFEVAGINFYGVKPCARCVMIGVDPLTAINSAEPLKTLSGYRKVNNKVYFGQNLIYDKPGILRVGDMLIVKDLGMPLSFDVFPVNII
jgi:uncharacterized protein YcbX